MSYTPIIVFAYNRPDHLMQTLDALAKNTLAPQSELFIYCDGPKDRLAVSGERLAEYETYLASVEKTRNVAHVATGFKSVTVVEREKNIGLMNNIVGAVTEIVNRYGRVIVLEDDMITSPGTLQYFNDALETYQDEEQVMHIVSYMFPHRWPLPETFFYSVPYPGGGWATWARAWKYYPSDIDELYEYWKDKWSYFNYWNHDETDLVKQLVDNHNGTLRTWFIRWYAVLLKMGGLTLYPGKSMVTNIGFDGTGDNCTKLEHNPYWHEKLAPSISVKKYKCIKENKLAAHEIYAFHSGRWYNKRRRTKLFNQIKKLFLNHSLSYSN